VIVEIPSGSPEQVRVRQSARHFPARPRALHSPIFYPGDYGVRAADALALDDDPLDVLILVSEPTFSGCLVAARPIGLLRMIDDGKEDDKVLAVPVVSPTYADVHNYTQIFPHQLRKIQHFVRNLTIIARREEDEHDRLGRCRRCSTASSRRGRSALRGAGAKLAGRRFSATASESLGDGGRHRRCRNSSAVSTNSLGRRFHVRVASIA